MVNHRAFRSRVVLAVVAVGFFLSAHIASSAELSLQLDSHEIELGRVFIGTLNYHGKSGTGPADLRPWEDEFAIERDNFSTEEKAGEIISHEDIRLYPRFSGELVINAIAHGGVIMEPMKVWVRPLQRDGINGQPILAPLPTRIQVGSPITVSVTVPLLAPTNKVTASEWKVENIRIVALAQQHEISQGNQAIKLRWLLYPEKKGIYALTLPAIEQRGNGRWRFHLPLQKITVFPLPSYLPPTLLVGAVTAHSKLIEHDQQPYWELTLDSNGLIDSHPWGLLNTISSELGIDEGRVISQQASVDAKGMWHRKWLIPVPQWTFGLFHGPSLTIHYFSPPSQRTETLDHPLPAAIKFPNWFIGVLAVIAAMILIGVASLLARIWRWLKRYFEHLRLLQAASDAHTLRRELLRYGQHRHLEAWAISKNTVLAAQAAADLNALSFSRDSNKAFDTVKANILKIESLKAQLQRRCRFCYPPGILSRSLHSETN